MSKIKKIITISILSIILVLIYIKIAKENRLWPFASQLSYKVPNSFKSLVYKFTQEKNKIIETFFYDLKISYYQIPGFNFLTQGGAIKRIDEKNILYINENGEIYLFDLIKKEFNRNKDQLNEFNNIRDIEINRTKKELNIVAIKEYENKCGTINLIKYNFELRENSIDLSNQKTIWESEQNCPFRSKISGSRVLEIKDNYYLSTGMFQGPKYSGIIPENWSQKVDSSFGKIIKIDKNNKASIYAMGLRNPQGLFNIKNSEIIFGSDHGPNGGDEINLINKYNNYGWPCISYGKLYKPFSEQWNKGIYPHIKKINKDNIYPTIKELKDYECDENKKYTDPIYTFQRTKIGISQGIYYDDDYFKQFKKNLIVSSLSGRSLFRFVLNDKNNSIISSETIYVGNRIRDLDTTIDGKLIAITDDGFLIYIENDGLSNVTSEKTYKLLDLIKGIFK